MPWIPEELRMKVLIASEACVSTHFCFDLATHFDQQNVIV